MVRDIEVGSDFPIELTTAGCDIVRVACPRQEDADASAAFSAVRGADLGVASASGRGQIFVKADVIKTVPDGQIVETLIEGR